MADGGRTLVFPLMLPEEDLGRFESDNRRPLASQSS